MVQLNFDTLFAVTIDEKLVTARKNMPRSGGWEHLLDRRQQR